MRRVRGTSTIGVEVAGIDGIRKALRPWLEPELTKELDVANKKAAQALAKELRSDLRPVSRHMARAVRVKRARTGKPGWVVGSRRKLAFFWHMVIKGTKAHGPRSAKRLVFVPGWNPYLGASSKGVSQGWVSAASVKGVAGRDLVGDVARRHGERVLKQVDQEMSRVTGT